MMAGNGQIGEEKSLPARQRVNPGQHPRDGGGFVHAEAGIVIAADIARIFQRLVTAIADNRLHPQVPEASRVEQGGAITGVSQRLTRRNGSLSSHNLRAGCRKPERWNTEPRTVP